MILKNYKKIIKISFLLSLVIILVIILSWSILKKSKAVKQTSYDYPKITLTGDEVINLCNLNDYVEAGYSAYDSLDGDLTSSVKVTKTNHFIYYEVTNSHGLKYGTGRIIKILDDEAPSIKLNGNSLINLNVNEEFNDPGVTVSDNCTKDVQVNVSSNLDITTPGSYTITYEAVDEHGNKASINRDIIVNKEDTKVGVIYLTFDDGPSANTSKILDILNKYNIKATFFLTNSGNDNLILREYEEGHTLGLHTATHKWEIYSSIDSYFNDLNIVYNRVKNLTGVESKYIRFPGGSSNTISRKYQTGIMSTLAKEVENRGFSYFDWNVDVEDAGSCAYKKDKEACVLNNFKKELSKNRINMVLLHDIKSYTANALEDMIKYALNNNYVFKKIDDTTPTIHQHINN